jgi:hypothetical protein
MYKYNSKNESFEFISKTSVNERDSWKNSIFLDKYIVLDEDGDLDNYSKIKTTEDFINYTTISTNIFGDYMDIAVYEDTLYLLTSFTDYSGSKIIRENRIYSTKDLSNFELIYTFYSYTSPSDIEYLNDKLYVGLGYSMCAGPYMGDSGALYEIDLTQNSKKLILDTDNKLIQISNGVDSFDVNYNLISPSEAKINSST